MRNSDEQSAKLESERALQQVIFSIMADNMEIFKQYQDNPSFKKWLSDLVFNLTYNKEGNTYEAPTTGKVTSYQNVDTPTLSAEYKEKVNRRLELDIKQHASYIANKIITK